MRLSKKHVEAFKDETNWVGSGLVLAACFFTGLPLAIPFVWAAYEAAYMLFVPDTKWYEQRLSRKADAEVEQRRRALKETYLPTLLEYDRRRFADLEQLRAEIEEQQSSSSGWFREILRKLDFLLERFLLFGSKRAQYLGYLHELAVREGVLRAGPPDRRSRRGGREQPAVTPSPAELLEGVLEAYDVRILQGKDDLERETDPRTQEVLKKNLDVLARLRANAEQIGQIIRNLERQMNLVVDSFALINGQLRTSPPEQMISDVDDVIGSSQTLTDTLAEVAPLEQALQRLGGP